MGVGFEYWYLYFVILCLRNRQPYSKVTTYWSEHYKYKKFLTLSYINLNLPVKSYMEQPFLYRSATSRILYQQNNKFE